MATWKERLHGRPGFLEEEELGQEKFGAIPPAASAPGISEEQLQRGIVAGADPRLAEKPSFLHTLGQTARRAIGTPVSEAIGQTKKAYGGLAEGAGAFLTGVAGMPRTAEKSIATQGIPPETQQAVGPGAITQPVPGVSETAGEQLTPMGMAPATLAKFQQNAWNHPNPQIQQWARSGPGGGIVQKRNRTYIPVIDQKTGLPALDERTGMMKHIEVIRGSQSDYPQEKQGGAIDPRAGIEAKKLAAGKERQMAGFGVKQAEALYKAADELIKAAPASDDPQGNYAQATGLRERADQLFGGLAGRGETPVPAKKPTTTQMKQFTIETDPKQLSVTRKYFMDKGEAGKEEFMLLPRAAQEAIFPPRR